MSQKQFAEVKYQTRQKHRFLEEYLRIWTERVGKNKGPDAPSLALFDLFAGTGWCHNADVKESWAGTATLMAQCLAHYATRYPTTLFLNSFDTNRTQLEAQVASLRETLAEIALPPTTRVFLEAKAVDEVIETALKSFDPDFPSLWILDPYAASDLPWSVIEMIARTKGTRFERRPELFITLMTFDLQRNIDQHPNVVSTALGMEESEWRPIFEGLEADGLNTREACIHVFGSRLRDIYAKPPHFVEVQGVTGNIVYVLFFCSDHDAGFHMMRHEALPQFSKWQELNWKRAAKSIATTKRVDRKAAGSGQEQSRLDVE